MEITAQTYFRQVGPVPFATWEQEWKQAGGRAAFASRGCYDAAGSLSGVILRLAEQESSFDTDYRWNSPDNWNPFNVRIPSKQWEQEPRGYMAYSSALECVAAVRGRINGEAGYFDGANPYADDRSIAEFLETYAPKRWNDTAGLIAKMVSRLNGWLPNWVPLAAGDALDTDALVFGRGVYPAATVRLLTKGNGQGGVWGSVYNKIGIVAHETQLDVAGDGIQELDFWFDFFNCPNGERCENAACHYIVSTNGLSYMLVDPRGPFEPYVNGGIPPKSHAWNTIFGSGNRNRFLIGVENNKRKGGPLSEGQIRWNAQLLAAVLDANKVPWYEMPYYKGVSQLLQHNYISPTDCMFPASQTELIVAKAKEFGRAWQLGAVTEPPVPTDPDVTGPPEIFPGLDAELAKRWFGKVVQNGRTYQLTWPLGPAATLWVEHGKRTGSFAPLKSVEPYADGRTYLIFADGLTLWRPKPEASLAVLKVG